MSITVEQNEYLTLLLQGLEPCCKGIYPNGRKFVEEQIARHEKYGEQMFLSPKQLSWLEAIYKEHVGTLPDKGNQRDEEPEENILDEHDDLLDDEIKF